jgi:hypothetical protein
VEEQSAGLAPDSSRLAVKLHGFDLRQAQRVELEARIREVAVTVAFSYAQDVLLGRDREAALVDEALPAKGQATWEHGSVSIHLSGLSLPDQDRRFLESEVLSVISEAGIVPAVADSHPCICMSNGGFKHGDEILMRHVIRWNKDFYNTDVPWNPQWRTPQADYIDADMRELIATGQAEYPPPPDWVYPGGPYNRDYDKRPSPNDIFTTQSPPVYLNDTNYSDWASLVVRDGAPWGISKNETMIGFANATIWDKEIWAHNSCPSRKVASLVQPGGSKNLVYMRLTRSNCDSGADQIVFSKPQFWGTWWDVGFINLDWIWDFFAGTRAEFTWMVG